MSHIFCGISSTLFATAASPGRLTFLTSLTTSLSDLAFIERVLCSHLRTSQLTDFILGALNQAQRARSNATSLVTVSYVVNEREPKTCARGSPKIG